MPVETARPLSARSVVLSLLLGSHPARWSAAELAAAGAHFDLAPSTLRTALARAVAAGDLSRADGDYVLGERLARRQRHQDEAVEDAGTTWDGTWEMAVVVVTGRGGAERSALRETMASHRLAELREGVWMRPANLRRPRTYADDPVLATFASRPTEDPAALAARLWDLDGWAARGRLLLDTFDATTHPPVRRLTLAAALVRHLTADPLLPADLLPGSWPGVELRASYARYREDLRALTS